VLLAHCAARDLSRLRRRIKRHPGTSAEFPIIVEEHLGRGMEVSESEVGGGILNGKGAGVEFPRRLEDREAQEAARVPVIIGLPVPVEHHVRPRADIVEQLVPGEEPHGIGSRPRLKERLGGGAEHRAPDGPWSAPAWARQRRVQCRGQARDLPDDYLQ
jgi:hypothetical protein